jgi:hypothetical protein
MIEITDISEEFAASVFENQSASSPGTTHITVSKRQKHYNQQSIYTLLVMMDTFTMWKEIGV